jgi:hypothetical protein
LNPVREADMPWRPPDGIIVLSADFAAVRPFDPDQGPVIARRHNNMVDDAFTLQFVVNLDRFFQCRWKRRFPAIAMPMVPGKRAGTSKPELLAVVQTFLDQQSVDKETEPRCQFPLHLKDEELP